MQEKMTFPSGAVREKKHGKGRFDLLSPFAAMRRALVAEHGAKVYGDRNHEKGLPFSSRVDSIKRHLDEYVAGRLNEDHLAQASFWLDSLMHDEVMIGAGFKPTALVDIGPNAGCPCEHLVIPAPSGDPDFRTWYGSQFYKSGCAAPRNQSIDTEPVVRLGEVPEKAARSSIRRIYVSGPLTDSDPKVRRLNIARASAIAKALIFEGFEVICPHTMTDDWEDLGRDRLLQNDFALIRDWADAIVVVGTNIDIAKSTGTHAEVAVARAASKPVFRLHVWLGETQLANYVKEFAEALRSPNPSAHDAFRPGHELES